jgi:hypothetical protein
MTTLILIDFYQQIECMRVAFTRKGQVAYVPYCLISDTAITMMQITPINNRQIQSR